MGTTVKKAALAAALVLLTIAATAQAASTRTLSPVKRSAHVVTFRVHRLDARSIMSVSLVVNGTRHRVSRSAVRRALRDGKLSLRVTGRRSSKIRLTLRMARTKKPPKGGSTTTTTTVTSPTTTTTVTSPTTTTTVTSPTTTPTATTTTLSADTVVKPADLTLADDVAAALVTRNGYEPRTANDTANHRVPTPTELSTFHANEENWGGCQYYQGRVTGNFTGTTDEIIQWAAIKWGLQPDLLRAVATVESWWRQGMIGDGGVSYGLLQIKSTSHTGTFPLSQASTAFNADYYAAMIRYYYDGCATWLNTVDRGQNYAAGDIWGSVGAWYAGRWHTTGAEDYITKVKNNLAQRVWAQSSFVGL